MTESSPSPSAQASGEAALAELEIQGYHCAAVLRRAYGQGAVRV